MIVAGIFVLLSAIVALVLLLISLIVDFAVNTSVSTILDGSAAIVIAIVIFWCANTIRKNA